MSDVETNAMPEYLTWNQAADYLGRTVRQVRRYVKQGRIRTKDVTTEHGKQTGLLSSDVRHVRHASGGADTRPETTALQANLDQMLQVAQEDVDRGHQQDGSCQHDELDGDKERDADQPLGAWVVARGHEKQDKHRNREEEVEELIGNG